MMTPQMAEDIAVLEQYLTSHPTGESTTSKSYNTIANTAGNPIIYLTVPKRRKGFKTALDPGRLQREIIEQVLHPFANEVQRLYFDYIHPCFPILDEKIFSDMWHTDKERISPTLLCDMYAAALPFWHCSDVLRNHSRPDVH